MNITDNFLDKNALQLKSDEKINWFQDTTNKEVETGQLLQLKADKKIKLFQRKNNKKVEKDFLQTEAVRKQVYDLLKNIEPDVNKTLQGLNYTLSADIYYDVDDEENLLITIIAETEKPHATKIKTKLINWMNKQTYTYPFTIPNAQKKQDNYSCFDTIGASYFNLENDKKNPKKYYAKLTFTFVFC